MGEEKKTNFNILQKVANIYRSDLGKAQKENQLKVKV